MYPKLLMKMVCWALPCMGISQQNVFYPPDARSNALGGAGVTFTDAHSALYNQAGLASVSRLSVMVSAEQKFLTGDIQSAVLAAVLPTGAGVFGMAVQYFGFQAFNEQKAGLSYARKLLDNLSIGAELCLIHGAIAGYRQKTAYTFELGLLSNISRQVALGFHVSNPLRITWTENSYLPTVIRLGGQYQPSGKLTILGEIEKDIGYPIRTIWGLEYSPAEVLQIRLGLATAPLSPRFGLGLQLFKSLRVDMALTYHRVLGFTPSAGFYYEKT